MTPDPTLAEYLASRGYQTAGFAANTNCCTYETGLARGFAHFEDYSLTPRSLLTRTVPGKWILENLLSSATVHDLGFGDFYEKKWIDLAIPRRDGDQRQLPRLAEPTAAPIVPSSRS